MHEHIYNGPIRYENGNLIYSPMGYFLSHFFEMSLLCLRSWMLLFGIVTILYISQSTTLH